MRTTIKDIAKYLNVSTTTVSRAINNKEDISDDMRQRVLTVAKMLDYKPNNMAISLRKKTREKLIGVVMPSISHYFFSTILRGITTSDIGGDYMIMIGESNHDVGREQEIINQFSDHYAAGIIIVPTRNLRSRQTVDIIKKRTTPHVLIDRTFEGYNGSFIQHDDYNGAFEATKHLISKGNKRIAMFKGDPTCSISQSRFKGYKDALQEFNILFDESLVISCLLTSKEEGYESIRSMYERSISIDAVFCITDQLAAGILDYALERQIAIPDQLSVVGYSNSEISQNVTPKLTTVSQNGLEMGKLAKKYMIEIIHHPDIIQQKIFESKLIHRQSS